MMTKVVHIAVSVKEHDSMMELDTSPHTLIYVSPSLLADIFLNNNACAYIWNNASMMMIHTGTDYNTFYKSWNPGKSPY